MRTEKNLGPAYFCKSALPPTNLSIPTNQDPRKENLRTRAKIKISIAQQSRRLALSVVSQGAKLGLIQQKLRQKTMPFKARMAGQSPVSLGAAPSCM